MRYERDPAASEDEQHQATDPVELHVLAARAREELALAAKRELAAELRRSERRRRRFIIALSATGALLVLLGVAGAIAGTRAVKDTPGYALNSYLTQWADGDEADMYALLCPAQTGDLSEEELIGRVGEGPASFDIVRAQTFDGGRRANVLVETFSKDQRSSEVTFDLVRNDGDWLVCTAPGLPSVATLDSGR